MKIRIGPDVLADPVRGAALEWLEANGRGGFAMGTAIGANTRSYHGLLVAALDPPVKRHVLLANVHETVESGGSAVELGAAFLPDRVHPRGFEQLTSFRLDPFPVFTYQVGDRRIEKAIFLVHGEDAVVVRWSLLAGPPCTLRVRPFIAFRDHHAVRHEDGELDPTVRVTKGMTAIRPYASLPELFFHHDAREVVVRGEWRHGFRYPREEERGLECEEDLFSPFELVMEMTVRAPAILGASTRASLPADAKLLEGSERARRAALLARSLQAAPGLDETLLAAADDFLVRRADGSRSVIAGYPWFTDWGRDTMISIPGLCLATGRLDDARDALLGFAKHLDAGMIPTRFPDSGEAPEYNNADGTLWFAHAIGRWFARTDDKKLAEQAFLPALREIVKHHCAGTRFGIRVQEDGLVAAGAEGVQLTWMDAKVDDWVVTPRRGKTVEINALWIETLETAAALASALGHQSEADEYREQARLSRESFGKRFWYEAGEHLYDVVDGPDGDDASLRPNQLFAVSLPHPAIDGERAVAVVRAVEKNLLTPSGLRTLAPSDPAYQARYEGGRRERDAAYHQGTVWPWLFGPFLRAWLRVNGRTPGNVAKANAMLTPLLEHVATAGLGQVPEVFDGDAPHRPGGCPAQAWGVAELLALLSDELGPDRSG